MKNESFLTVSRKPYKNFQRVVLRGTSSDQTFRLNVPAGLLKANRAVVALESFAAFPQLPDGSLYNVSIPGIPQQNSWNSVTGNNNTWIFSYYPTNGSPINHHAAVAEGTCGVAVSNIALTAQNELRVRIVDGTDTLYTDTALGFSNYVLTLVIYHLEE